jgi:hypothetical protein
MTHIPYEFDTTDRAQHALQISLRYSQYDGVHHKDWCNDQVLRALTGCPVLTATSIDCNGAEYSYEYLGESEEYLKTIKDYCNGEDGPETYSWDTGMPA